MIAAARLLVLGTWIGLAAGFVALVATPAFSVLPGTELTARLIGVALDRLDQFGMALGVLAACLGGFDLRGRGGWTTARAWLPLLGVVGHALSYLWVTPEIQALRESAGGTIGQLAAEDPRIARFGQLHVLSMRLVGTAMAVPLVVGIWDSVSSRRSKK